MEQVEIDGQVRTFDRIPKITAAQGKYLIAAELPTERQMTPEQEKIMLRGWRFWFARNPLDQGSEGACVGFGWAHFFNAGPIVCRPALTAVDAVRLYKLAQDFDEWPSNNYEGSSVNGGALAMRAEGRISRFLWAWDVETMRRCVLLNSPLVAGTWWTSGMLRPDAEGYLHPEQGMDVGGHAYLIVGYSKARRAYKVMNSWGPAWGKNGFAWIREEHFEPGGKLSREMEMCVAEELCLPKAA